MKLSYAQLGPHLASTLSPVYIVSGDELLLKLEAVQMIRKAAKRVGYSERTRLLPEAGFDWEQLYTLLYSGSLLAEKRLIELDCRDALPNKTAAAILETYGKTPSPHHLLLIDIGKIDDKIAKSAWYKALEKIGMVVTIWPLAREQLPQWIMQRAKKYKLTLTPAAAHLLSDYIEGNLVAAAQALEKIYLLKPDAPVDIDLIQALITNESHFTVFDFIESLIAGDKARTLAILDSLKDEGTEPVLILWGITREIRLLLELTKERNLGQPYDKLFQKHRIFARRQAGIRRFLNAFSSEDQWHFLRHAAHLDQVIKGATPGNIWDDLQLFCLRMV
jgi:DNA polymerase III subunit delta